MPIHRQPHRHFTIVGDQAAAHFLADALFAAGQPPQGKIAVVLAQQNTVVLRQIAHRNGQAVAGSIGG